MIQSSERKGSEPEGYAEGGAHPPGGISKGRLAAALGKLLYRSGLYKLAWRNRAVVVLFHRVDDRYPEDAVTCSRALFVAFCDFFAKYFTVVTLSELVELLGRGADISRRLVITFDDGYRDNERVAAAELRKRGLSACFFITTGFVSGGEAAWWDVRHSIQSEWMNWDEVRSLRDQGFEIGAHTITHPDCALLAPNDAMREIVGSKTHLEAELGAAVSHFAYPFGGPDQMTEEIRSMVREVGFRSCVAAHGGTVHSSDDPFRLRRTPINSWYLSPYQFGFAAIRRLAW